MALSPTVTLYLIILSASKMETTSDTRVAMASTTSCLLASVSVLRAVHWLRLLTAISDLCCSLRRPDVRGERKLL